MEQACSGNVPDLISCSGTSPRNVLGTDPNPALVDIIINPLFDLSNGPLCYFAGPFLVLIERKWVCESNVERLCFIMKKQHVLMLDHGGGP